MRGNERKPYAELPPEIECNKTTVLLMALGEGTFDFSEGTWTPCTSEVNWEDGTGKRTVSFEWNGKSYALEAKVQDDWFDLNIASELNKIIIENGKDKQLCLFYDI